MTAVRKCQGFTFIEVLIAITILTAVAAGSVKVAIDNKKASAKIELTTRFSYYEELLLARGNLIASNLMFWINNVDSSATNAGRPFYGFDFTGAPNTIVAEDFVKPLVFSGHTLYPVSSYAPSIGSPPLVESIRAWYNANSSANPTDPTVQRVAPCFNPSTLSPSTSLVGVDTFRFCLALGATKDADGRQALANGSMPIPSFVLAVFTVTSIDIYSSARLVLSDRSSGSLYQPNRSYDMVATILSVKGTHLSFALQQRFSTSRTYSAPKQARMLINCGHCLNAGDPAFMFQCPAMLLSGCSL